MAEIDDLMDFDPLELSSRDIDVIIAYYRNNRAKEGADGKMKKAAGPKPKVDLTALIQSMTKKPGETEAAAKPPTGGGLRRL